MPSIRFLSSSSRDRNLIIAIGLMCFLFFLLPKFIWNFNQSPNTDLISFISPLPLEYLDFLHTYRENNSWFPINLFVQDNFGKVTTVIGFQILILFMVRTNSKKFWEAITLTVIGILTIYIFGMLWLGNLIGWDKPIFQLGATPFLLAELFKVLLLAIITKWLINFRNFT